MNRPICSVGADLGGTWIRVHATNESGQTLKKIKAPAPDRKNLPHFFRRLWHTWKIQRPKNLCVGSRGVWLLKDRQTLRRSLNKLADSVRVISDVELAFESSLTPKNESPGKAEGILILAGTGSIALGRNKRGRVARAGGLGPLKGDEGSGYWIGQEYLRRVQKSKKGLKNIAHIAALSPKVFQQAASDKICRAIIAEAQGYLANLVLQLVERLDFRGEVSVSWAGSLMGNTKFRKDVFQKLLANKSIRFKIVPPKNDPAEAAARWAGTLQGFPSAFLTKR